MRIAIDIPFDLNYAGDEDWQSLIALREGETQEVTILGTTYTSDTVEDAEAAIIDHWQTRLTAAAERLGHEILYTQDAAEAHDWTLGQDQTARWEAFSQLWQEA